MKNIIKSELSVKVINDTHESEILACFKTLHHTVLQALQSCDITAQFNTDFAKCGTEDLKNLHQQSRALVSGKVRDRKEKRVSSIRLAIQGVVDTYMSEARAAKAAMDAMPENVRKFLPAFNANVRIPLTDIRACFPQGASDSEVFGDLEYMGYKVTDLTAKGAVLVPFKAEEAKVGLVAEAAPESGEAVKAA